MQQPDFQRPAPVHAWLRSNILGLVAIFIALSGTAVAANVASDSGKGAKAAKKKKAKAIPGPQGPAGPAGAPGATGATGATGTSPVRASAQISGGSAPNTVLDSTAVGIADANVVRQAAGLYCISGLSFTPKVIEVTQVLGGSNNGVEAYADTSVDGDLGDCPGSEQAEIFADANGAPIGDFFGTDVPLFVTIY